LTPPRYREPVNFFANQVYGKVVMVHKARTMDSTILTLVKIVETVTLNFGLVRLHTFEICRVFQGIVGSWEVVLYLVLSSPVMTQCHVV
jgi:hypothetical protein